MKIISTDILIQMNLIKIISTNISMHTKFMKIILNNILIKYAYYLYLYIDTHKSFLLFIYIHEKKLATVVKGNQKSPFSIATTPMCKGGRYSFHWIAPLYPWFVTYISEC